MRRSHKASTNLAFQGSSDDDISVESTEAYPAVVNSPIESKKAERILQALTSESSSDNEELSERKISETSSSSSTRSDEKMTQKGGITYSWQDIRVSTGSGKPSASDDAEAGGCFQRKKQGVSKEILRNVTGVARPFELLAIMGASGAGKTTLLNVLTFRNTQGLKVSGTRCANGLSVSREKLSTVSAYVQQDDLFIGTMTVREHLVFQARLRMHSHIPLDQRLKRVEEVLRDVRDDHLGLTKCADTMIGIPGRTKGISGGEMKRLSFASEVLTDPPLMFCDEPTSGLDSYMAQNVVETLKNLAGKGKTIICTIHQPSSEVYALFDRILLMSEGRTAYLGGAKEALGFFHSIGHNCPVNFNPADFFIETLAIRPGHVDECRKIAKAVCDTYDVSSAAKDVAEAVELSKKTRSSLSSQQALTSRSPYKASWFQQFSALLWRSRITILKDPMLFKVRLGTSTFTALLFGLMYLRQELDQEGIMNISGVLFLMVAMMTFQFAFGVVNGFIAEVPVFLREHFNGMYRTDVYFLTKNIAEFPIFVVIPFIFATIVYWMVGLSDDIDRYLISCAILIILANVAVSYGYLVSCIAPNLNAALTLLPLFTIPIMIFGGFFLNTDSVPVYFIWLRYLSWYNYGNEAMSITQWRDVTDIKCNRPSQDNSTCITEGSIVLETYGFSEDNFVFDLCMLGLEIVVFRFLAFIFLLRKTYAK